MIANNKRFLENLVKNKEEISEQDLVRIAFAVQTRVIAWKSKNQKSGELGCALVATVRKRSPIRSDTEFSGKG